MVGAGGLAALRRLITQRISRILGPRMAILFLVRHGQASFAAENYDRLSELGRQQSAWLGEYFAERGIVFARAVCGTLERQRETARAILQTMGSGLTAEEHPGWNEYSGEALYKAYLGDEWANARAKGDVLRLSLRSADRNDFLKKPRLH